jgi:hypothetical protein
VRLGDIGHTLAMAQLQRLHLALIEYGGECTLVKAPQPLAHLRLGRVGAAKGCAVRGRDRKVLRSKEPRRDPAGAGSRESR